MFRNRSKQRGWLGAITLICLLATSCGNKEWRLGNFSSDPGVMNKRHDERDHALEYHSDNRWDTTKHYVKQHKKKDGKINLFKRDGFDWGF